MEIVLILCICVYGVSSQGTSISGPTTGFTGGGFSSPFGGPFGPVSVGGPVFGPTGPLRPLSPPMSPMAMMMASLAQNPNNYRYATCNFNDTWTTVRGRVDLRQFLIGEGRQQVQIRIQVSGMPQSAGEVERGIHVHEFGDIGDGCARVGPHFNPNQTPHGSRRNFAYLRHVGDLGNIRQSTDGLVSTQFVDQVISLEGSNNVVGRAFVIKLERDDEGMGNTRESRVNGNTHTPLACCTIGRTTARNWYNPMSALDLQNMAATGMMPLNTIDPFNTNTLVNTGFTSTGGGPGFPTTGGGPGFPATGGGPGFPTTGGGPGFPSTGGGPGFPTAGGGPGFPSTGGGPGFPTAVGGPGFPSTGGGPVFPTAGGGPGFPATGGRPGFPSTGGGPGFSGPGFPATGGTVPGFTGSFPGTAQFGGSGSMTQPGFGSQPGFSGTGGLTQPGFGGTASQVGFGAGGLTQAGFSPQTGTGLAQPGTGLTQPGAGLPQPGFGGTGSSTGTQTFGAGTFMPGAAPGQTFNFATQGKK